MRLCIVDAFTDQPFAGNPAAVCLLEQDANTTWMQAVAAEMNLSETAFLVPQEDGFGLRWFTPKIEVDLCGHATLASAHFLWSEFGVADDRILFHTKSGVLPAMRLGDRIELDFPMTPVTPSEPPEGLLAALGVQPDYVGESTFDRFVLVGSEEMVRTLAPDFHRLRPIDMRGVIVTGPAEDPQFDFVSRYFAPAVGVDEDPVTGSAHCCLAPFWGERFGKTEMTAYQASARGGVVQLRLSEGRVHLGGQAVTVLRGDLA